MKHVSGSATREYLVFGTASSALQGNNLTASSETLIWKPINSTLLKGIESAWEAYILVPVDYESEESPLMPINIKKFQKQQQNVSDSQVNLWFLPGGPGQSSQTLDLYMDYFVPLTPPGAVIYAIDHRGLGKSTPISNFTESEILKINDRNPKVLPAVMERKQKQLGLIVPLTRVLRVENVARDLLTGVKMVETQDKPRRSRNFLISFSYGTVIARRAVQIRADAFEAVLFDGLAALERIEMSNEADRALEEFCDKIPHCRSKLLSFPASSGIRMRSIIPEILNASNQCTKLIVEKYDADSLCKAIHILLNGALMQGLAILKVATLNLLFEMKTCTDEDGFSRLLTSVDAALRRKVDGNALQSVAVVNPTSATKNNATEAEAEAKKSTEEAISVNEFVFEVISTLERYHITSTSVNICFNKKHSLQGDTRRQCPLRLFDPCRFFQTTYERKQALSEYVGELPGNSIKDPITRTNSTRLTVLAGLLDFNTPTYLAREIANQFFIAPEKYYYEFLGLSHGIFGSSGCEREIFADFFNGGNKTAACVNKVNEQHTKTINSNYFNASLTQLSQTIEEIN